MSDSGQDKMIIEIRDSSDKVLAECAFYPDKDADFIAFFEGLTYEEQDTFVKGALRQAMLKDKVAELRSVAQDIRDILAAMG